MNSPQLIDVDQRSTGGGGLPYWLFETSPAATTGAIDRNEIKVPGDFVVKGILRGTGGSLRPYVAISPAPSTAGQLEQGQIRTLSSLKLERRVSLERQSAQLDRDSIVYANAAVRDALSIIRRHNLSNAENVMISEDGLLSIQWRNRTGGAAMVFMGDGKIMVSFAKPGKLYSQKPTQFSATDTLPQEFLKALEQFQF